MKNTTKINLFAVALLLTVSLVVAPATAITVDVPLTDLVSEADSVVIGTVVATESRWNADRTLIQTYVTIQVDQHVAKASVEETITLVVDGGTVDDITLWVSDTPVFWPSMQIGVLLKKISPDLYVPYGLTQGVYAISDNEVSTDQIPAYRMIPSGCMTSERFIEMIRMAEAGIEPSIGYVVPEPIGEARYEIDPFQLSPGTASAGTDATVTITGSGFGTKPSRDSLADVCFFFIREGDSLYWIYATGWLPASNWQEANANAIQSWTNTEIVTHVPAGTAYRGYYYSGSAGSGPVVVLTEEGQEVGPYEMSVPFGRLTGWGGIPSRWSGEAPIILYYVNPPPVAGSLDSVISAAGTWTEVPGSSFTFEYAGTTTATEIGYNGKNEILWAYIDQPGVLAQAASWRDAAGVMYEADIRFNTQYSWSTSPSTSEFDIEAICLHELGHWVQLADLYGNIAGYPSDTTKVMYGRGAPGEVKRTLHPGDREGIEYIYPAMTPTFSLNLKVTPEGSGTVIGAGMYEVGELVTITATPEDGWTFASWTDEVGAEVSVQAVYDYTMPARDVTLTANFELELVVIPLPGSTDPPTDPDGDGLYEDLNGNGRLDFADVVVYFEQMEWIAANEPVDCFDYNGNGRIDWDDVVVLFGEV
ncbi:hypothetical protein FGU65_10425 [Methanoculleus sp. FWC-SCC1]|uniref:Bacterial repeat domain-containing protein n=1 Tax=Methanoculleus frigidifontis TaxID=2584085 RepID=A0ABT8MBI0_9EURY|nr:matrixin family metalloprotease [Methanoculleus sp. FWC-SCC1]MDN7025302.1 hypothetical protein [Methanoculleus sp. FWC-SCC1]